MTLKGGGFAGFSGLSSGETRVLGCLLEKQLATPDGYPLTLNALRSACNQSTSRDPVVDYDDALIRDALHRLERRGLTRLASGRGSRAPKYRHLLNEMMPMTRAEQAVMCMLMLRGEQTPGELKQRSTRLHAVAGLDAVTETLQALSERGLARRLERRAGHKEERYAHTLERPGDAAEPDRALDSATRGAGEGPANGRANAPSDGARPRAGEEESAPGLGERVARLEREVAALRAVMSAGQREHVAR